MAYLIQFIAVFIILLIGTGLIINRRMKIQKIVSNEGNIKVFDCENDDFIYLYNYKIVRNPFLGHVCKYFENRIFHKDCDNWFYSPVPSNTMCFSGYREYPGSSLNLQMYHTWSDCHGNFYVFDPLIQMYAKWNKIGNLTDDWGISKSYFFEWEETSSEEKALCFQKFGKQWCQLDKNKLPEEFFDFIWNPFLGKKCNLV